MSRSLLQMAKIEWGLVLSLFTISLLLSSNSISADTANLDYSTLAVNEGDTFVYELAKLDITDDIEDTVPIDINSDGIDDFYLKEGDQYTMTIVNTTIVKRDVNDAFAEYFDQNTIEVAFSSNGNSVTVYTVIDALDWVSITDWDNYIPHAKELVQSTSGGVGDFEATETEDIVHFVYTDTASEEGVTVKLIDEDIYNKTTGVKIYSRAYIKISYSGDSAAVDIILKLVDYTRSGGSDNSGLPAFEIFIVSITLVMIIKIKSTKRKSEQ